MSPLGEGRNVRGDVAFSIPLPSLWMKPGTGAEPALAVRRLEVDVGMMLAGTSKNRASGHTVWQQS